MAEFQELAKAINDNSQCLVQTVQGMSEHNRTMIKYTKRIVAEVGSLDLGEASDEKSQIFLSIILTQAGNKDKPERAKHKMIFEGNLDKDLVKEIEEIAFSRNKVVKVSDEKKGKDFSDKYRPNDRGRHTDRH